MKMQPGFERQFSEVRHWVFDLDNTLYPPSARLFDLIEKLMTGYVMRELGVDRAKADFLRSHYWKTYGTTLAGLMREHQIDPLPYLQEVHEIPLDNLEKDFRLRQAIERLPGRRIVYTNGSQFHADRVLEARGLSGIFHAVYGIEHADFRPKPERAAFEKIFQRDKSNPTGSAIFEDDVRNLEIPADMGVKTILVGPKPAHLPTFVDCQTEDLTAFLELLV